MIYDVILCFILRFFHLNFFVWSQKDAEDALAEALPALEAARLALDDLDKSDVTEIRSFAKPPKPVQTVCECIVVMRGKSSFRSKFGKNLKKLFLPRRGIEPRPRRWERRILTTRPPGSFCALLSTESSENQSAWLD